MAEEVLAVIPARGGSRSVPGKNLRALAGLPLLAWTIRQAQAAACVSRTVVSTDDDAIAAVAKEHGAEVVRRPTELSGDTASSESALLHALDALAQPEPYDPDLLVFLQCTSPLRPPGAIDAAVAQLRAEKADSLLSVVPFHGFLWTRGVEGAAPLNYDYRHRPMRQEKESEYLENGSIYVMRPELLRETGVRLGGRITLFTMPAWCGLDINDADEIDMAAAYMDRTGATP